MDALNPKLILHRTSRSDIAKGIPVITRGEGVYVFDEEGKRYMDLLAGGTRPVHLGYGREDMARAIYDQACRLAYFTPMQSKYSTTGTPTAITRCPEPPG